MGRNLEKTYCIDAFSSSAAGLELVVNLSIVTAMLHQDSRQQLPHLVTSLERNLKANGKTCTAFLTTVFCTSLQIYKAFYPSWPNQNQAIILLDSIAAINLLYFVARTQVVVVVENLLHMGSAAVAAIDFTSYEYLAGA